MVASLSGAIIAAGRGERLRDAVANLPKPLVEIGGETLLVRQLRAMATLGLRPVHLIVNSETFRIMTLRKIELPDYVDLTVRDTQNSMESLLTLGERLVSEYFVLATVDAVLAPAEFRHFVECACQMTSSTSSVCRDGALGLVRWRGDRHPLFAEVTSDGLITALDGRESENVTAGVYFLPRRIFDHAAEARARGLDAMRRFLALLIEKGMRFAAVELKGVIDVDEGADLEIARSMYART